MAKRRTAGTRPGRPRVAILGGGFAGLSAALELAPDRHEVTLIDQRPDFEWLPNIHELLSGVKTPELLRLPLARTLRRAGHRFVRGTVTAIDCDGRRIETRRRRNPIPFDALIVAIGGIDATRGVPGVAEHAWPFKSVEQCERIGRRLGRLAGLRRQGRVVIVGGGLEGVEALGEILRRHRRSRMHVTLVEAGERLLPETPAALDAHLRELCRPFAVDFELGTAVREIEPGGVVLADGRSMASDCTIWTGGPAPPPLLARSGLAPREAWAPVDHALQSKGHAGVFIAGDAAEGPTPIARQAYHALDMGVRAARNARRWLAGDDPAPFRPSPKPMLISFGDLSCFLVAGKLALAGAALGAAKEAVYELGMAQLDAQEPWQRVPDIARRAERATRHLLWPTLTSAPALLRQARLSVLSLG